MCQSHLIRNVQAHMFLFLGASTRWTGKTYVHTCGNNVDIVAAHARPRVSASHPIVTLQEMPINVQAHMFLFLGASTGWTGKTYVHTCGKNMDIYAAHAQTKNVDLIPPKCQDRVRKKKTCISKNKHDRRYSKCSLGWWGYAKRKQFQKWTNL